VRGLRDAARAAGGVARGLSSSSSRYGGGGDGNVRSIVNASFSRNAPLPGSYHEAASKAVVQSQQRVRAGANASTSSSAAAAFRATTGGGGGGGGGSGAIIGSSTSTGMGTWASGGGGGGGGREGGGASASAWARGYRPGHGGGGVPAHALYTMRPWQEPDDDEDESGRDTTTWLGSRGGAVQV
jgi:hypothetical protein